MSESQKTWAWYYEDEPIQGTGSDVWWLIESAVRATIFDGRALDSIRIGELSTLRPSELIHAESVLDEIKRRSARMRATDDVTASPGFPTALAWIIDSFITITPSGICEGRRPLPIYFVEGEWIWHLTPDPDDIGATITYSNEQDPERGMAGWVWSVGNAGGYAQTLRDAQLCAERRLRHLFEMELT